MRGWQLSDIKKLSSRGFRVNVAPVKEQIFDKNKNISFKNLLDKVQLEFNTFIRTRDAQKGCISCQSGKVQQASHFYSVGDFSAMRFNEDNCHGSCLRCNFFKHGNLLHYRQALIKRIGVQRLENLEFAAAFNRYKKWSMFELELVFKMYREENKSICTNGKPL